MEKIICESCGQIIQLSGDQRVHIVVKSHFGVQSIPINQVRYFKSVLKYTLVDTLLEHEGDELLINDSIKSLEMEFANKFIRINRNILLARRFFKGVRWVHNRIPPQHFAILEGGDELDISRPYHARAKNFLRHV